MDTPWFRRSDPVDDKVKMAQAEIVASIKQTLNFNYATNRYHRSSSFQDDCVSRFPSINMLNQGNLDKAHLNEIGVLVCMIGWDSD